MSEFPTWLLGVGAVISAFGSVAVAVTIVGILVAERKANQ